LIRSKVPPEFTVQYPHYANPPTLFMALEAFMDKVKASAECFCTSCSASSGAGRMSEGMLQTAPGVGQWQSPITQTRLLCSWPWKHSWTRSRPTATRAPSPGPWASDSSGCRTVAERRLAVASWLSRDPDSVLLLLLALVYGPISPLRKPAYSVHGLGSIHGQGQGQQQQEHRVRVNLFTGNPPILVHQVEPALDNLEPIKVSISSRTSRYFIGSRLSRAGST
jgi:hypothetical protein